jgi:hypothetical protein
LQKDNPDNARIASLTNRYFFAVALQGVMQIVTIIIMDGAIRDRNLTTTLLKIMQSCTMPHDAGIFWRDDERSGLRSTKAPGNVRIMYCFPVELEPRD